MLGITSQNITDLISFTSQFIDDLMGLLVLLMGISLGVFIVQSLVIMFTGKSIQKNPIVQEIFEREDGWHYDDGEIYNQREDELWP